MSLPLPRPVGVESDDELLTLKMHREQYPGADGSNEQQIKNALSAQLPEGFELISVNIAGTKSSFQPCSATYVLSVRQECLDDKLKGRINELMASENLFVRRPIDKVKSKFKNIDVRCFLSSIELDRADIIVECGISGAGSIRVQEVLELLELDETKLDSPTSRTNVKWREV